MSGVINTAKAERRTLHFGSIDDLLREVDRIVAAERDGKLRCSGNWTAGQVFNHIAAWIDYGYEGYPPGAHPPFFIRWLIRLKKNAYLRDGMKPGIRIPTSPEGTFGTEACDTEQGAARLRASMARLKNREPVTFHSPAFGPMSDEQRIAFQLRHAELHFGFLHP